MPQPTASDVFEEIVARFASEPTVSRGTGFGSMPGLRVGGKIFTMVVNGELVVKLPKHRVDALVESSSGSRFDPGHGRPMKEWASVPPARVRDWLGLAEEAFRFVSSSR